MSGDVLKRNAANTPPVRKAVALAFLCLMAMLAYQFLRPAEPQRIAQRTVDAIARHDVNTLCQLADQQEFTKLNLTPAKVEYILKNTVWSEGVPQGRTIEKLEGKYPIDEFLWTVKWKDEKSRESPLMITINQKQSGEWHLNLARLLYSACWWEKGGKAGMKMYYQIAKEKEIDGYRGQEGQYVSMQYLRGNVIHLFGSE